MADIGVPQFTEGRDTLGSSEGADLATAGRAIAGAAEAVQGHLAQRKTEDLRGNLKELGDAALNPNETVDVDRSFEIRPELNAEEERLFNDLRRMQSMADRTSGTRRAQVVNKAKQLTQQALSQSRNPRTRSALVTEFNQFVGLNPALDVLGLQDQQDDIEAEFAEKQMQVMFDKSFDSVSEGGYGIDSRIIFGSEDWVKEFSYRQRRDAQTQANLFALESFDSSEKLGLRQQIPVIDRALQESQGTIDTIVREDLARAEEVGAAMQRLANDAASHGDQELVNAWEVQGKQVFQSRLLAQQAELEVLKVQLQGSANLDEFGKGTVKRIEAQQAYLDKWISIAENLADRPDIIKLGEYEKAVRERNWRTKNPQTEELIFNLEQIAPVLENAETLDLNDALISDQIGQFSLKNIVDTLSTNDVFGDSWQRMNGTPAALLDRANYERSAANDVFGPDSEDPVSRAQASMEQIMSSVAQRPNFEVALRDSKVPLPAQFFNTYMSEASHLEELRQGGNHQPGTLEQIETLYGSDTILDQTVEARSRKLDPGQNTSMQALGEALFRYNTDSNILGRKGRDGNALNQTFGEVRLGDVVEFDFSGLDQGEVRLTVDEEAGDKAAAVPSSAQPLVSTGYYIGRSPILEQQRIEAAAAQVQANINRYLRYEANVAMLRGNAQKPNYVLTWDQNRYNEIFVERPRGE
jgi:hypothetical protein